QQPLNGLSRLEIPSPGGFFSGLSPRARHTWHMPSITPDDVAPPTSTTAEQFYRCPWQAAAPPESALPIFPPPPPRTGVYAPITIAPSAAVEHVVEVRGTMSDGMPT